MRPAWLLVLCVTVALASCGRDSERDDVGVPSTILTIEVEPKGADGPRLTATLECGPPGGDHPQAAAACTTLDRNREALDPLPPGAACTQIYGGPQRARIHGTLGDTGTGNRELDVRLSRANGCEIERWHALAALLELDS